MISKDEFVQWKNNPVTEEVLKQLTDRRLAMATTVLEGRITSFDEYQKHIGAIQAFNDILDITFEEVNDD